MAITEIYVDPSIDTDSGTGTIGDPFGDLEYAIIQTTFDVTNGTRVNIKSGTAENIGAELETALDDTSVSIAWNPTRTAPCIFQGYTATAGDGGLGVIDGGAGGYGILLDASRNYTSFIDLELRNTGIYGLLQLNDYCNIIRCVLHNTSIGVTLGDYCTIIDSYVYDFTSQGIRLEDYCFCAYNFVDGITGTGTPVHAIYTVGNASTAYRNIIKVEGATDGIQVSPSSRIISNSIYSNGGTGQGIVAGAANITVQSLNNNIIEGFSGTGGIGIDMGTNSAVVVLYGGNSVYDCETSYSDPFIVYTEDYGINETLSESAFTDPSNNDFSPIDTGNIKEGSIPSQFPSV